MWIKVIDPNTTASMTAKIAAAARAAASPGTEIIAAEPDMGPVSIEGHYDEAVSALGVLDGVRKGEADEVDGYVIACFGDPGLLAAREVARGPVLGIAEAVVRAASLVASGFSIVTTLGPTRAIIEQLVWCYGAERLCRGIHCTGLAVLDLDGEARRAAARAAVLGACPRALADDGAEAIVLGCAGMADLAGDVSRDLVAPVIDGVGVAVKFVEALASLGLGTSKVGSLAFPIAKPYRWAMRRFAPGGASAAPASPGQG